MTKREEFLDGWKHFCECIDFGRSYLDADAISFMNEFKRRLEEVIDEEIR